MNLIAISDILAKAMGIMIEIVNQQDKKNQQSTLVTKNHMPLCRYLLVIAILALEICNALNC